MGNDQKPKSNHEPPSSNKKDSLIEALRPLCSDFIWMNNLITTIKMAPLIESDLEILGLARKIIYELIEQNPNLFEEKNVKTLPLKNFIIQLINNIEVLKSHQENIDKVIEDVYNSEKKIAAKKNQSKL